MATPLPSRFLRSAHLREQHGTDGEQIGQWLLRGDPTADAAIRALASIDKGTANGWIELGCLRGAVALPANAPMALREFFQEVERTPAWIDEAGLRHGGGLVLRTGLLAGVVLASRSIVLGYASPGGNKPLVFAGGLTERAPRRLNETARFVKAVVWPGGMQRHREGYAATLRVRLMHAHVRVRLHEDSRWRTNAWGVPINQHDMAATTLLFSLIVIDGLRRLGIRIDEAEAEAYYQLWRYVGHLMGVDHDLLPARLTDAWKLWRLIEASQGPPDADTRRLVTALCHAVTAEAKSPGERRMAAVMLAVIQAAARKLHGAAAAHELGFGDENAGALDFALPRVVRGLDVIARRTPTQAIALGMRYWQGVADKGMTRYGVPFLFL